MLKPLALLCIMAVATYCAVSNADELTAEKIRDIKTLMSVSMNKEADQAAFARDVDNGLWMLKQQQPQLSEKALRSMHDEAIRLFRTKRDEPGGLLDRLVMIYHRHFTHEDVKQILQFLDTPVGQKVKAFLAVKQSEALPIVEQWGEDLAREWSRSIFDILMKEAMPPPM